MEVCEVMDFSQSGKTSLVVHKLPSPLSSKSIPTGLLRFLWLLFGGDFPLIQGVGCFVLWIRTEPEQGEPLEGCP